MQMHKYYIYDYIVIMYILYTIVPKHSGPRGHQALQQSGETMLDNYDHTRKTIILPDQGFHNGRLWQIQGSVNEQAAANVANVCNAPVADQVLFWRPRIQASANNAKSTSETDPPRSFFYLVPPSLLLPVRCRRASFCSLDC